MIALNTGFLGFISSCKKNINTYIESFTEGFNGNGWKIWEKNENKFKFEIDEISIRDNFKVYNSESSYDDELNEILIGKNYNGSNGIFSYSDNNLNYYLDSNNGDFMSAGKFIRPFIDVTNTLNINFEQGSCFYMNISRVSDIAELYIDETKSNFEDGSQFNLVIYSGSEEATLELHFTNNGDELTSDQIRVSGLGLWTFTFVYCKSLPNIQMSKWILISQNKRNF